MACQLSYVGSKKLTPQVIASMSIPRDTKWALRHQLVWMLLLFFNYNFDDASKSAIISRCWSRDPQTQIEVQVRIYALTPGTRIVKCPLSKKIMFIQQMMAQMLNDLASEPPSTSKPASTNGDEYSSSMYSETLGLHYVHAYVCPAGCQNWKDWTAKRIRIYPMMGFYRQWSTAGR